MKRHFLIFLVFLTAAAQEDYYMINEGSVLNPSGSWFIDLNHNDNFSLRLEWQTSANFTLALFNISNHSIDHTDINNALLVQTGTSSPLEITYSLS